jgi:hypothetical protein
MARKLIVNRAGTTSLLSEVPAQSELQLQEQLKEHPELLPINEFGLSEPLMVLGRETILPSGGIDLVGVARTGDVLLIEFKTGPQNPDFRQALAQLLDYGSDLWGMTYERFERTVALRFFSSDHCKDVRVKGMTALGNAAQAVWPDLSDEERSGLRDRLTQQLETGAFHYVVVAQRFVRSMEQTINYMNATSRGSRFYAIELVRFASSGESAFECRTIVKPTLGITVQHERMDVQHLLDQIDDDQYRDALEHLFTVVQELALQISPGTKGLSVRLPTSDRPEPVSIGWLFPPGVSGWMGLTDLTLGHDPAQTRNAPSVLAALKEYLAQLATLPAAARETRGGVDAYHIPPPTVVQAGQQIADYLAKLVNGANAGEASEQGELRI